MNKKLKETKERDLALHRFSIISPLISGTSQERSNINFFEKAATQTYVFGGVSRQYSMHTIKTWYYNFKKSGFDGLVNNDRCDSGNSKSLPMDAMMFIEEKISSNPKIKAPAIFKKLVEEKILTNTSVSLRTIQRYCSAVRKEQDYEDIKRKRFQSSEPCDIWQTDTSVGPFITVDGKKKRTYLIMFLDDASRFIVGYGFFFEDNEINMQRVFKMAIKQYGKPRILYADNGKTYTSTQLKLICAKLGIELKNTRPYDPQAKGKIERCFRTIKECWMRNMCWDEFRSLADVMESFESFLQDYHRSVHSTIKKSPHDVFFDYENLRTVTDEDLSKIFMHEFVRKADKCAIVSYKNRKYEVPTSCIGKKCTFRFNPEDISKIFFEEKECKLLDMNANCERRQKSKVSFNNADSKKKENNA